MTSIELWYLVSMALEKLENRLQYLNWFQQLTSAAVADPRGHGQM
jgi:hypothetical protein